MFKKAIAIILVVTFMFSIVGCGPSISAPTSVNKEKAKFARISSEGVIGGVCSGIAYYTATPTWIWRTGFVVVTLLGGAGILAYLVLWVFMPEYNGTPYNYDDRTSNK